MNIFLVEDQKVIRERLKKIIAESGGLISGEASKEDDAIQKIQNVNTDMLIVDLKLEQGSGLNVVRRIRKLFPQIIVVVFTNHGREMYEKACLDAGADLYMDKSVNFLQLVNLLNRIISISQIGNRRDEK